MYNKHNQELHDQLTAFLLDHSSRTGAKVLGVLIRRPNRALSVIDIAFRVYHYDLSPLTLEAIAKNAFRGIPTSDAYARKQFLERRNLLLRRRAAGETNLDWEIGFLNKELRRITKANGEIRHEYPELRKAYHCFKMALNRLTDRANTRDQELAAYIRAHLRTGIYCIWWDGDTLRKERRRENRRKQKPSKSKQYITNS